MLMRLFLTLKHKLRKTVQDTDSIHEQVLLGQLTLRRMESLSLSEF